MNHHEETTRRRDEYAGNCDHGVSLSRRCRTCERTYGR
jgi:hypothetical protein